MVAWEEGAFLRAPRRTEKAPQTHGNASTADVDLRLRSAVYLRLLGKRHGGDLARLDADCGWHKPICSPGTIIRARLARLTWFECLHSHCLN